MTTWPATCGTISTATLATTSPWPETTTGTSAISTGITSTSGPSGWTVNPGRRLAGRGDDRGRGDTGDENDDGNDELEGFGRHQSTSSDFGFRISDFRIFGIGRGHRRNGCFGFGVRGIGAPVAAEGEEEVDAGVPHVDGIGDDRLLGEPQAALGLEDREQGLDTALIALFGETVRGSGLGHPIGRQVVACDGGLTGHQSILHLAERVQDSSSIGGRGLFGAGPGSIDIGTALAAAEQGPGQIGDDVVDEVRQIELVERVGGLPCRGRQTEIRIEVGDRGANTIGGCRKLHLSPPQIGPAIQQSGRQTQRNWIQCRQLRQRCRQHFGTSGAAADQYVEGEPRLFELALENGL